MFSDTREQVSLTAAAKLSINLECNGLPLDFMHTGGKRKWKIFEHTHNMPTLNRDPQYRSMILTEFLHKLIFNKKKSY